MQETLLAVDGMKCGSCVRHIQMALLPLEGIGRVEVRLGEGTVWVSHAPSVRIEQLVSAIGGAGYRARAAEVSWDVERGTPAPGRRA